MNRADRISAETKEWDDETRTQFDSPPKTRLCLKCRTHFTSEWAGERDLPLLIGPV
jgi:hypothetical protein